MSLPGESTEQDKLDAVSQAASTAKGRSAAASAWGTVVMIVLLAVVFYTGHRWEWRVPKFSELSGATTAPLDDWCKEHNVPESICVNCRQGLMPAVVDHGWCAVHAVHNCVFEHPEVAQLKQAPDPDRLQALAERATMSTSMKRSKANNSRCQNYLSRIQFASIQAVEQAGVEVEPVEVGSIEETLTGNGEIVYDPARTAALATRQPGSIFLVSKNIGDPVTQGEVLALIDAKAVGDAKAQLLHAMAEEKLQSLNVKRLQEANAAIAQSRTLEAQAALSKATADLLNAEQTLRNLGLMVRVEQLRQLSEAQVAQALKYLGIPDEFRAQVAAAGDTTNLLPVVAPIAGTIIKRQATMGQVVDPTDVLFEIVDSQVMWLMLSLPLESLDRVKPGQQVRFTPTGSERTVQGAIDWISPAAEAHTRMVQVRVTISNSDGALRHNTFGSGQVVLRSTSEAVLIPTSATHWEGCCQVVFVRDRGYFDRPDSPKVFHVRSVRLGASQGNKTEVLAGLLPGEVVATAGSDVLRAQLLKNGLGAGCCVEE